MASFMCAVLCMCLMSGEHDVMQTLLALTIDYFITALIRLICGMSFISNDT